MSDKLKVMKSHSDQHPDLQYVEVVYFEKGRYVERKSKYEVPEAIGQLYQRTVNKMTEEKKQCLVMHRDANHQLIKSFYRP